MALDFPSAPAFEEIFGSWQWDGTKWTPAPAAPIVFPPPVTVGSTAPASPRIGDLWYNTSTGWQGQLYTWVTIGGTPQWAVVIPEVSLSFMIAGNPPANKIYELPLSFNQHITGSIYGYCNTPPAATIAPAFSVGKRLQGSTTITPIGNFNLNAGSNSFVPNIPNQNMDIGDIFTVQYVGADTTVADISMTFQSLRR